MAKKSDPAMDEAAVQPPTHADPKTPKAETPRDERHDSIDPATGTLSEEAVRLRAEGAA